MNLSVKEGKKLGKRRRGSSGWVTQSLFSNLFMWDIQTALFCKREGGRLCCLKPIILWRAPAGRPFLESWVGSKFIPLLCAWAFVIWTACSRQTLVRMVLILLWPEKPRKGNMVARRPLPWRDQYPQLSEQDLIRWHSLLLFPQLL